MTWNTHFEQNAAKGNKKFGFLFKRNLKIFNPDIKSCAYKTLVRPTLEYCNTVWDPHTAKAALQLEIVQHRAARWVKNDYIQQCSVTQMLIDLNRVPIHFQVQNSRRFQGVFIGFQRRFFMWILNFLRKFMTLPCPTPQHLSENLRVLRVSYPEQAIS